MLRRMPRWWLGLAMMLVCCSPKQDTKATTLPEATAAPPAPAREEQQKSAARCSEPAGQPPLAHPKQVVQRRDVVAAKAMAFSSAGVLATLGEDYAIRLWDANQHFLLRSIELEAMPFVPDLSWEDEKHLSVVGVDTKDVYDLDGAHVATRRALRFPEKRPENPFDIGMVAASRGPGAVAISRTPLTANRFGPYGPALLFHWQNRDRDVGTRIPFPKPTSARLSPEGDVLIVATASGEEAAAWKTELYAVAPRGKPRKLGSLVGWATVLAVSPRGERVALGVQGDGAQHLAVVETTGGKQLWTREPDPDGMGPKRPTFTGAAFSPTGQLAVVALSDGRIQSYDAPSGRYQGAFGARPRKADVATFLSDTLVAVSGDGSSDAASGHAALWDLKSAGIVRSGAAAGADFLGTSPDGALVLVPRFGAPQRCGRAGRVLHLERWEGAVPRSSGLGLGASDRCIEGLSSVNHARLDLGLLLIGRNMPRPGQDHWSPDLAVYNLRTSAVVPLEDSGATLGVDPYGGLSLDGRWVSSETSNTDSSWRLWDANTGKIALRSFGLPRSDGGLGVSAASALGGTLAVAHEKRLVVLDIASGKETWHLDFESLLEIVRFGSTSAEIFVTDRAGAIHRVVDRKVVAFGASDGSTPLSIELAPGGKTLATTSSEGVVRIWDAATLEVRVALAEFDDDEWVAFTPGGAYAGTREVADRIGWVFDDPLEGFSFEQFSAEFSDRSVVTRRIAGENAEVAGRLARPPRITQMSVEKVSGSSATINVQAESVDRVDTVRLFVEGRPVAEQALCSQEGKAAFDVPLYAGINRVTAVAYDARGAASNATSVDVRSAATEQPEVWVVAVGVGKYPHLPEASQLPAAENDARGIAAAFSAAQGSSFADAHLTVLVDDAATPARIRAALSGLRQMKPADLAVVFFAGHGIKKAEGSDMRFATGQVRPDQSSGSFGPDETLLGWSDIASELGAAKGRVLVLLDACHAGHVTQELLVPNDALAATLVRNQRSGSVIFAAAKGRQESLEPNSARGLRLDPGGKAQVRFDTNVPHGFFTGAILTALRDPEADRNGDGNLQLSELVDEASLRVARVTGGLQTPWVARRDIIGDFTVVRVP